MPTLFYLLDLPVSIFYLLGVILDKGGAYEQCFMVAGKISYVLHSFQRLFVMDSKLC